VFSSPNPKEFEFKNGGQFFIPNLRGGFKAQTALSNGGIEVAVGTVLMLIDRELGRPDHIVPVGIVLSGLCAHVELGIPVNIHGGLADFELSRSFGH
jgi:hypothetical protein